jgi:hypothetical protein
MPQPTPGIRFPVLVITAIACLLVGLIAWGSDDDGASATPTSAPADSVTATPAAAASSTGSVSTSPAGRPSSTFTLGGLVEKHREFNLTQLQALPKTTVMTNPMAGGAPMGQHTHGGPLLYDLIQQANLKVDRDG